MGGIQKQAGLGGVQKQAAWKQVLWFVFVLCATVMVLWVAFTYYTQAVDEGHVGPVRTAEPGPS
jgi:hypothetical protein